MTRPEQVAAALAARGLPINDRELPRGVPAAVAAELGCTYSAARNAHQRLRPWAPLADLCATIGCPSRATGRWGLCPSCDAALCERVEGMGAAFARQGPVRP